LTRSKNEILILGGSPDRLSAEYFFTKAELRIRALNKNSTVGGFSNKDWMFGDQKV